MVSNRHGNKAKNTNRFKEQIPAATTRTKTTAITRSDFLAAITAMPIQTSDRAQFTLLLLEPIAPELVIWFGSVFGRVFRHTYSYGN